jgi:hypothetical protein
VRRCGYPGAAKPVRAGPDTPGDAQGGTPGPVSPRASCSPCAPAGGMRLRDEGGLPPPGPPLDAEDGARNPRRHRRQARHSRLTHAESLRVLQALLDGMGHRERAPHAGPGRGPAWSRIPVRSMITETHFLPRRVCCYTCSSIAANVVRAGEGNVRHVEYLRERFEHQAPPVVPPAQRPITAHRPPPTQALHPRLRRASKASGDHLDCAGRPGGPACQGELRPAVHSKSA